MGKARLALGIGVAVALMAAVLGGLAYFYYLNFSPDHARYPIRGIDVSQHQGTIDWQLVASDGVQFAVIKATEGGAGGRGVPLLHILRAWRGAGGKFSCNRPTRSAGAAPGRRH